MLLKICQFLDLPARYPDTETRAEMEWNSNSDAGCLVWLAVQDGQRTHLHQIEIVPWAQFDVCVSNAPANAANVPET